MNKKTIELRLERNANAIRHLTSLPKLKLDLIFRQFFEVRIKGSELIKEYWEYNPNIKRWGIFKNNKLELKLLLLVAGVEIAKERLGRLETAKDEEFSEMLKGCLGVLIKDASLNVEEFEEYIAKAKEELGL